jgi:hemolysin-activating ACP:hemolysin acyltransferase
MFRSEPTKNDWKSGKRRKISNHIAPFLSMIRVVDEDLAHLLGEKC